LQALENPQRAKDLLKLNAILFTDIYQLTSLQPFICSG
jgi:hypothetical protein